ncbi:MAG: hypothetical protein NC390_01945 [Fusobacterium sp.]|nr:hypothetical protein [Fusobacterium sp.]
MILSEFSKYIQTKDNEIISNKSTAVNLLSEWIQQIMSKNPKTNVEKIIHSELTLARNKYNEYLIIGKSESGRVLMNALYNYALSYEHYVLAKTI